MFIHFNDTLRILKAANQVKCEAVKNELFNNITIEGFNSLILHLYFYILYIYIYL
jgi:hypothetical protein